MNEWRQVTTMLEGQKFEIEGISIHDHTWQTAGRATLKDSYGKIFSASVYEIEQNGRRIRFAVEELSNDVYGIFQE